MTKRRKTKPPSPPPHAMSESELREMIEEEVIKRISTNTAIEMRGGGKLEPAVHPGTSNLPASEMTARPYEPSDIMAALMRQPAQETPREPEEKANDILESNIQNAVIDVELGTLRAQRDDLLTTNEAKGRKLTELRMELEKAQTSLDVRQRELDH